MNKYLDVDNTGRLWKKKKNDFLFTDINDQGKMTFDPGKVREFYSQGVWQPCQFAFWHFNKSLDGSKRETTWYNLAY